MILAAAIILPIVFKDDIRAAIDAELEKSVNADVVFDTDNLHISLFTNFPNLTVGLSDFGVINRAPFDGQVLLAVENFEVEINLKSVLFDDQLRLKGIYLDGPQIYVTVLEDGTANYDIAVSGEETEEDVPQELVDEDEASDFSFGIDRWEITNGYIVYDDKSIPVYAEINNLNHSGSGDFTLEVFDLVTNTTIDELTVNFDGTEYMSKRFLGIDMTLNMDLDQMRFEFEDNVIRVNDFAFGFDGWFSMLEDGFDMDLTYSSTNNSFKSLLSLVPAVYTQDFSDIKTTGTLGFNGAVRGKYTETTIPAFNLTLLVDDAMFQYPDLPASVDNIGIDFRVSNTDGIIDNTTIEIRKFHMDFGNNPIDAKLLLKNLVNYPIEASASARFDLGELSTMFPMEGLEMRGIFDLNLKVNGIYDSITSMIPAVDVAMSLTDGYIKSSEFPIPLENIHLVSSIINESGKMAETVIKVDDFSMVMGGEEIHASMTLENLDDYTWDVNIKGGIDIGKMMEIFPQEGMTITGLVKADITTKGKMSDLEAERYSRLPTSGTMSINNFGYSDNEYLSMGFVIDNATASFDPKNITLTNFVGSVGNTDMSIKGKLSNYLEYMFQENEVIKGNLSFNSNLVDVNQFMTSEETTEGTSEDEDVPLEVVQVPEDIDFVLTSNIKRIVYDNMNLNNVRGKIIIKNGILSMDGLAFDMLGGSFVVNGSYNALDIEKPVYDFDLGIKNLSIKQSYATFNTIQTLAPIAQNVSGNFSTDFKINGVLGKDMMPLMNTLNGGGLIEIAEAAVTGSKLISGISSLTSLSDASGATLKDVLLSASIKDGRFSVKPFDMKIGNYKTNVGGSTGLDGTLDYVLKMDIPAGKIGAQLNSSLASLTGSNSPTNSDIKLTIGVGGTYENPKPKLLGSDLKEQAKKQVVNIVKEQVTKKILGDDSKAAKTVEKVTANLNKDSIKTIAEAKKKAAVDSLKRLADAKKKMVEDSLKKIADEQKKKAIDAAKDKVKDLFKRKKKN